MNVYKRPFDDQRQMRIQLETVAITTIFALIENGDLSAQWSFIPGNCSAWRTLRD